MNKPRPSLPRRRSCAPLIRSEHFIDSSTSLAADGLAFDRMIGHEDRESEVVNIDDEELVPRFADRRPSGCVINPRTPSMRKLRKHLKLAQVREMFGESIDVTYGLPMRYDRCWSASRDASGSTSEGQSIVMVCFDGESVVGYAGLGAFVMRDRGDPKVTLSLAPELVYVVPSRRGQGFGMDLSVACGIVAQELLRAVYNAVPARTDLVATVIADYESEGGESFTLHLKTCLECEVDMLREGGSRRTVTLGRVELDAGY